MDEVLRNYNDLLIQKRYSQNTQDIYCNYFKDFCMHFSKEELVNITTAQINSYILDLIKSKNISISQQNQRKNAIKFYYEKVLGRKKEFYELNRPRKENKLPKVLSKNEIKLQEKLEYAKQLHDIVSQHTYWNKEQICDIFKSC